MASLVRLLFGLGIATGLALTVGMLIGMLPYARSLLATLCRGNFDGAAARLAAILFIMLGLGEISKIALIVIGVMPVMIRELALRAIELPRRRGRFGAG